MERSEHVVPTVRNGDTARLAGRLDDHEFCKTWESIGLLPVETNVRKPVRTLLGEESACTPASTRVLQARGRSRSVRIHMSLIAPIPTRYKETIYFPKDKLNVLRRAIRSRTPH
jgi:hypothetical protein